MIHIFILKTNKKHAFINIGGNKKRDKHVYMFWLVIAKVQMDFKKKDATESDNFP